MTKQHHREEPEVTNCTHPMARDVIAGVAVYHQFTPVNHSSIGSEDHCRCGFRPRGWREWSKHFADAIIAAGVSVPVDITTTEQLDELPFLTVIREVRQAGRGAIDYGGVYERRTSGWQCISGTWAEATRNGPPSLPVRVLWQGVAP